MKNMQQFLMFVCNIMLFFSIGCKKTGDATDCKKNNYGVYKISFSSTTIRHHILVSIGIGALQKDLEIGVLSDTLHIYPGEYPVTLSSINDMGAMIDRKDSIVTIVQCSQVDESVAF